MHVRHCLCYMCVSLLTLKHLSVFLVFISELYWACSAAIKRFWCLFFASSLIGNSSVIFSGDWKFVGLHLRWLGSASSRRFSCCHHHNLSLSFSGIIMAMKQASLWLSTGLFRPFRYLFFSGFELVRNREPKCWTRALWWSLLGFVGRWWSWLWPTTSTGKLYLGVVVWPVAIVGWDGSCQIYQNLLKRFKST